SSTNTWQLLWYAVGSAMADSQFQKVVLPLRAPSWFHSCFQLRWKAWGSTWGAYDNWLIAYTYILRDTAYNPVAWERLPRSYHTTFTNWVFPSASSDSLQASFVGREGQRIRAALYVNQQSFWRGVAEIRQGRAKITLPSLSTFSPGTYLLEWRLERVNPPETLYSVVYDTLRLLPDMLSYDDGEVERGYGVRQAGKAFLQDFELDTAWQITAVGIKYFIIPNQIGKPFQLGIWRSVEERQPLYLKYERVYPDSAEGWRWYRIDTPIVLRGKIGVGLIQADAQPLGVGWDAGCSTRLYLEQGGSWVVSGQGGCLHIRLRLAVPQTALRNAEANSIFSIPSPLSAGAELPKDRVWAYPLRLWNAQGQLITQWGAEEQLQLPYQSGLYFLQDSLGRSVPILILP
ncbi:MAG: hypothetical protein NZ580_02895, partial [Bacteroidia bacterium]|nr:hypothetical protein [Bacteroidia bacterium]